MLKDQRRLIRLVVAALVLPIGGCIDAVPQGITDGITTGLSAIVQGWIESTLGNLAPK